jgi:hypothetical protein
MQEYDEEFMTKFGGPKKTILDKLLTNAFGKDASKLYSLYPQLMTLTQPNYPVISPRGDEIINKMMFRDSLQLLDSVVKLNKE